MDMNMETFPADTQWLDPSEFLLEEINGGVDFFILLVSFILIFWTIAIWPFLENLVSLSSLLFYS